MLRRLRGYAAALAVGWAAAAGAADLDLRQLCDHYTPLTLVGIDTTAGLALFTMPSRQSEIPGWIVELWADGRAAVTPDWRKVRRFGGSMGPGAVLVTSRCGDGCLQALSWSEGAWRPLGGPLSAPPTATVYTTRDAEGVPWLVLHRPTGEGGVVRAEGWRLEDGRWSSRGELPVAAVGSPAARPARGGGVLTGSGRFSAAGRPLAWVVGLPGVPAEERGQLVPLAAGEVAYLARDGRLYLSRDGGASWEESHWLPWAAQGPATAPGWTLDLPLTDHHAPLAAAWFDNRDPERPQLHLAERPSGGPWQTVARLPAAESSGAEPIGYSHLLRHPDGRWQLVAGCEARADGVGLLLRTVEPDGSSVRHNVRLRPTWLDGP